MMSMYFHDYSFWKYYWCHPSFKQIWILFTLECFLPSLSWLCCSGEEDFKCRQCILPMISLWYQPWPFIWTNLNPLYPRNAFCLVCLKVFLEKKILNFVIVFSVLSPLEKGMTLHLNKTFKVSLKLTLWFWRRLTRSQTDGQSMYNMRSDKLRWDKNFYILGVSLQECKKHRKWPACSFPNSIWSNTLFKALSIAALYCHQSEFCFRHFASGLLPPIAYL